jgi:hypothetical protein
LRIFQARIIMVRAMAYAGKHGPEWQELEHAVKPEPPRIAARLDIKFQFLTSGLSISGG